MSARPSLVRRWLVLWAACCVGALSVFPYALTLQGGKVAQAVAATGMPRWLILVLSFGQNVLLFGVVAILGWLAADAARFRTPVLDGWLGGPPAPAWRRWVPLAVGLGVAGAVAVPLLDLAFRPFVGDLMKAAAAPEHHATWWMGALATLYGGICEETLTRLFAMSALALLLRKIGRVKAENPAWVAWTANVAAAALFGLGHLPATAALVHLTPAIVARAVVLNGAVGVAFGWMYWRRGLVPAMATHAVSDLGLHVLLPLLNG